MKLDLGEHVYFTKGLAGYSLWASLRGRLGDSLWDSLRVSLGASLWGSLKEDR